MDWENHSEKKSDPKNRKTVKIRVKLPHVNKKPLPRNRTFVQTLFSHSTLKLERKKFTPQKPLAFSLHFLFRRDQNHHSNLTSKVMKMCEQILKKKKKTAPQYNWNSLNCKKTKRKPIIAPAIAVRLLTSKCYLPIYSIYETWKLELWTQRFTGSKLFCLDS